MNDVALAWGAHDDAALDRRVRIIDDLLGAVLLLAALAFVALLELTRRQICAVYQLAFVLCACSGAFIVGGLVDHQLSDEQLNLALYSSHLSSALATSYVYLPVGVSVVVAAVELMRLSTCSCECCCLQGSKLTSHRDCFAVRLKAGASLYATACAALWVLLGVRLNVRLRSSAINPIGGTVHWLLLRSPFYMAAVHLSSVAVVELKAFLQHADKTTLRPIDAGQINVQSTPQATSAPSKTQTQAEAMATTLEELMRPPMPKAFTKATAVTRTASRPHTPQRIMDAITRASDSETRSTRSTADSETTVWRPSTPASVTSSSVMRDRLVEDDDEGDVSSMISSDSEGDNEVLVPNFSAQSETGTRMRRLAPRATGYSSSTSVSTRARAPPAWKDKLALARTNSADSYASTHFLSDSEDHGDPTAKGSAGYYSDNNRPSTASSTTSSAFSMSSSSSLSAGIRRRAAAAATAISTVKSPWVEYFDSVSGSVYLYNQITGESRWRQEFS